ncbi:hypothetical protein CC77DRAFT_1021396 [Alternaria alternata]|uniref:C3H1-type domain-containing protein n=1 Tax=Alternaria alternata TaxID=5599 RepID=A0A177DHN4_ALTAL|nr:hypothetical protein CC77DRAFT_1021396 [Alternaria alternata]OAG19235.1 hypothetical protein CC77DRAFT_1021396 [Alternaria alternata]
MKKVDFKKLCEDNIAKYEAALNGQQEVSLLEATLAEREAADSSQLNHLFAGSSATENSGLFVRQPPKARKPPIVQSESSSSEGELTDDSLMAEMATTSENTRHTSIGVESSNIERRPIQNSAQSPRTSLKRATTTPNPNSVTKPSLARPAKGQEPRRSSLPQADSGFRDKQTTTVSTQRKKSNNGKPTTAEAGSASAAHDTLQSSSTSSGAAKRSVSLATQPSALKTTTSSGKSSGIRIVNEPKPQPRQATALPKKTHFQTLRRHHEVDMRSRREGTPDVAALNFVNAPPDLIAPKLPAPHHDPYARRDPIHRRIIAEEPQNDESPRQESTDGNIPLAPWEIDKVPQVCYQWRLSQNCTKSARECRFMHRHKDEKGREYSIADMQGKIPGKYRKPPLTCPFWLNGQKGCRKSAEDCLFAHQNTGWIKHSDPSMGDVRIDPDQQPKLGSIEDQLEEKRTTRSLNPDQLTCWYWNRGDCRNTEQECAYQHRETGIVANAPHEGHQTSDTIPDVDDDMDIDDAVQPPTTNEATRTPSPIPSGQPQQFSFQPPPPPPPPPITNEVKIKCEQLRTAGGSVCTLDFEDMFASNGSEEAVNLLESRVFLMYHPEDHFEELEIITRWLLLHHVQVASTSYQGAWAVFKQQILQGGSGIIIAHPDVEYFTAFPGFGEVLRQNVRLWSVGLQPSLDYDHALTDGLPVLQYERIEIFPLGGFVYITEEVFETKPQLALEIVKLFFAKIVSLRGRAGPLAPWQEVDDASLLWRLCVRPELMEYLFQRCEDHAMDVNAGDVDMQSCAKLYSLLAETNYIEQDDPVVPLSAVADKYPILSERRAIAECEPVDYFNTVARSKEAANLNMIRYYAGLQVDMRRDYRHFYVVHTEPKAKYIQEWKQEIQTIADVITPEQCINEMLKDGQDSMFDFYERFMADNESSKGVVKDGDATTRVG